jgi:hypothetical protein
MYNERLGFLTGSWQLLEAKFVTPDGSTHMLWGPSPVGLAIFAPSGDFAAHVMRAGRGRFEGDRPTAAEKQQAYDDYFSYFGHILRFDAAGHTMVSRVWGASNPNWIGGDQIRYLDIETHDHIVFRTPPLAYAGTTVTGELRWQRRGADAA